MKAFPILALAAVMVLADISQVPAQSPGATIEQRQAAMRTKGTAMRTVVPLARGDVPWNAAAAIPALESILATARETPALFPAGTGPATGVRTRASPAIWERPAEFEASAKSLADAAEAMLAAARANDEAAFRRGLGALSRPCASCHESFRSSQ
jgi:cytochrome c556